MPFIPFHALGGVEHSLKYVIKIHFMMFLHKCHIRKNRRITSMHDNNNITTIINKIVSPYRINLEARKLNMLNKSPLS